MPAPTNLGDIKNMLERHYSSTHEKMYRSDRMYRHDVGGLIQVPDGMAIHESSTSSLMVDGLRDQVRTDVPLVTYETAGKSKEAERMRQTAEMWGEGVLHAIGVSTLVDPLQQTVQDFLLRGAGCIKHLVNPEYLLPGTSMSKADKKKWEQEKMGVFPWLVKSIDPLSILPAPGSRRPPAYVLEIQTRTALDMEIQYGDLWHDPVVAKGKRDPGRHVEWLEYWSSPVYRNGKKVEEGHYIVEADGQRIIEEVNPYGMCPYIWSYSGLGRANFDGDPSHLAEGILDSIIGELEEEIRIKTAWAHQWLFSAYPRLLTTDDPRKVRRQFMVAAGSVIKYDPGQKPEWMQQQPPNEAMLAFLDVIMANIARKVNPALFDRPSGVDAGVHQALLLGQALKVIGPVRRALDIVGGDLLNGMARQMAHLGIDMNLRGSGEKQERMIKGKEFKHFNFKVQFEAVDPVENDRRMLAGLALRRERADGLPLISRQTFMEQYMGGVVENIEEEEVRLLAEAAVAQIVQSGSLMQAVMQDVQAEDTNAGLMDSAAALSQQVGTQTAGARERGLEQLSGAAMPDTRATASPGAEAGLGGL
jgi:hypothetical protein